MYNHMQRLDAPVKCVCTIAYVFRNYKVTEHDWLCHLDTYILSSDTEKICKWPNDKTNDSCENDLYTIK